jgi:hypothetical protein
MRNILLSIFCIYGIGVSGVSLYWGLMKDMPALEHAVKVNNQNAEMRHRINVFADGTWVLLGNLITVASLAGLRKKADQSKE